MPQGVKKPNKVAKTITKTHNGTNAIFFVFLFSSHASLKLQKKSKDSAQLLRKKLHGELARRIEATMIDKALGANVRI